MNARRLRLLRNTPAPAAPVSDVRRVPLQLTPIPWGQPDPVLGRAICRHIAEVTPPVLIPCNPITEAKTRRLLHAHNVSYL